MPRGIPTISGLGGKRISFQLWTRQTLWSLSPLLSFSFPSSPSTRVSWGLFFFSLLLLRFYGERPVQVGSPQLPSSRLISETQFDRRLATRGKWCLYCLLGPVSSHALVTWYMPIKSGPKRRRICPLNSPKSDSQRFRGVSFFGRWADWAFFSPPIPIIILEGHFGQSGRGLDASSPHKNSFESSFRGRNFRFW